MQSPRNNGQILILFLFFLFAIFGLFIVNLNIGDLIETKMRLQTAADNASLSAINSLGYGMGGIAAINDDIIDESLTALTRLAEFGWLGPAEVIGIILYYGYYVNEDEEIVDKYVSEVSNPLAKIAAYRAATLSGADTGVTLTDNVYGSYPKLQVSKDYATRGLDPSYAPVLQKRKDLTFPEKATVVTWNDTSKNIKYNMGDLLDLETPLLYAMSTAQLYYTPGAFGSSPDDFNASNINQYNPRYEEIPEELYPFALLVPGPFYQGRLISNSVSTLPSSITDNMKTSLPTLDDIINKNTPFD